MIERVRAPDQLCLDRLAALHAEAFAPHARGWSAAEIAKLATDGALFTHEQGFILVSTVLDEAEVLTIAVAPAAQGQGVGRQLLDHMRAALPVAEVFLEVAADNAPALALYRGAGFAQIGLRRGYYRRPDAASVDAIVMKWRRA